MGPQSATTCTKTIAAAVTTNVCEFLVFKLGAEDYGIDILRMQKIRSHEEPTRIAKRSPCPEGGLR
jgi:purine-binding chemotaxis protein CheW